MLDLADKLWFNHPIHSMAAANSSASISTWDMTRNNFPI